jgi:fructoselysine-6-P-deglycase FrlB-like protein
MTQDSFEGSLIDRFILEQIESVPKTAHAVREQLSHLAPRDRKHIVFIGSGTSLNALIAVRPLFQRGDAFSEAINPGEFMRRDWQMSQSVDVIALSQTGTSETTVAALLRGQQLGLPTLTITAEVDSPIAQASNEMVILPVGPEPVGPKTKGYTASLAALIELASWRFGGAPPEVPSASQIATLIEASRQPAANLAEALDTVDCITFVGESRHYGTALEASLKIAEITGIPSAAFPTEEAMHGRFHGITEKSLCIIIAADQAELWVAAHAAAVMAKLNAPVLILNLTEEPTSFDWCKFGSSLRPPFDTIAAILPIQRLAEVLAVRRHMAPHEMRFPGLSRLLGIKIDRLP